VPTFRLLVLEHFRDGLVAKAHEITSPSVLPVRSLPQASDSGAAITDVTALPEYIQLHAFTQQLTELEKNIALYQTLAAAGGVTSAPSVFSIESYLDDQSKSSFVIPDAENPYFAEALAKANFKPFIVSQADRENASQKMTNLTSTLFARWIGKNPIRTSLDNLSELFGKAQGNPLLSYQQLQELKQAFRMAQSTFDNPSLQWVAKDNFEMPGELYGATVTPLQNSIYLNKDLTNWVTYDAEHRFSELQDAVARESSDITGPLVEVTEEEKLVFSENADSARLALINLLGLPFLASDVEKTLTPAPTPGTRVIWKTALLQNASQLPQAYENYIDSDLENSTPKLRTLFQHIAHQRLQRALETEIVQAETIVPQVPRADFQQDVQPQIESFSASGEALAGLLVILREQQMSELYYKLLRLSGNQAGSLLTDLDRSFEEEKIYALPVASFDQWTGNNPPTEAILDVRSPDDLAAYLTQQREAVRSYSQSAAPLLRFLGQQTSKDFPASTLALINKWKAIATALSQYDKKSPVNSLTALESFISIDMDKVTPAQMCQQLPLRASNSSGDYFLRVKANLRADLYHRCRAIANFNLTRDYRDLENTFNSQLAGHFPFADLSSADQAESADPQAVNAFYQKFDAKASLLQSAIRQINSGSAAYQEILSFLDRMAQLRSLFPASGATDAVALPAVDFQPTFRVNRIREIDGDQVLSWTLTVGNDVFHSGEPPRVGHWIYGQPVTLSLQWAKDAPSLPLKGAPSGDGSVSGPVIRFEFKDSWALLSMLLRHRAQVSQIAPGKDTSPFVLQFQAYESAPGNYRPGNVISSPAVASVFLQMNLFPVGAKQPIQQAVFPTRAVELPSDAVSTARIGDQ
jgi:type VI secretion system protein ImpL